MNLIEQRYIIKATPEKVWDALTNPKTIEKWGGGPVKMSDKVSDEFSFWGGDIYGKNVEVEKNKKLVQEWYGGEWESPSIVSFTLNYDGNETEVILLHKDLPKDEIKEFDEGWRDYFMGPLKKLLEK